MTMIVRAGSSLIANLMLGTVLAFGSQWVLAADNGSLQDLERLSLEQLANLQVTSVSKSPEELSAAPAAIYVITHDDIVRSGATSLVEILRLAPNLLVTQLTNTNYAASARGFSGNPDAQNFSNKLLMLIDGRSVYTPLYSGVYHDSQDVLLEDIDRIEVISGPGATLWGANAMNGVVNVITRPAYLSTDGVVTAGVGNLEQNVSARYGSKIDDALSYRVYAKGFRRAAQELANEVSAQDQWYQGQAGFRFDWSRASDAATLQGDVYRGLQNQLGTDEQSISGGNALVRWQRSGDGSNLQIQAYADQSQRAAPAGGVAFVLHTYDIELQQTLTTGAHRWVWGGGERLNRYSIRNSASLLFMPPARSLSLGNLFAQDTVSLGRALKLTGGVKLEDDAYSGWSVQPDLRLAWQLSDSALLWSSASHAIRSPTPFDVDVVEKIGAVSFLTGKSGFDPERLWAYEVGYRGRPAAVFSVSMSAFYHRYDDLRTIEPASPSVFLPLHWDNLMEGHTTGLTAWAQWRVAERLRLSPGVTLLHRALRFKAGASRLLGLAQAGDDASSYASLAASLDLPGRMTVDASVRYVGALPEPALPHYYELTARWGWRVTRNMELSVSGTNLLHAQHLEYPAPNGEYLRRGVFAAVSRTY